MQVADMKRCGGRSGRGFGVLFLSTLAGILAPLIFLVIMTAVGFLQPGYDAVQEAISKLVLGLYGWFQTVSFFVVGSLLIVFALGLYIATLGKTATKVGFIFLLLSGIGFLALGAFPVVPDGAAFTAPGVVHSAAVGVVSTSFVLGSSAFSVHFRGDREWSKFWLYTVVTAIACAVFALLWTATPERWLWKGLSERLLAVTGFAWVEIVSLRLLRLCLRRRAEAGVTQPNLSSAVITCNNDLHRRQIE